MKKEIQTSSRVVRLKHALIPPGGVTGEWLDQCIKANRLFIGTNQEHEGCRQEPLQPNPNVKLSVLVA